MPSQKLLLLPIAWGITALIRIAQGSATVAMITAVGIVGPIALAGGLPFHPVYLAVAIGAGSKIGMWMNDSGFWVIAKMSGMTEAETLKTASVMVFIEGCVGLVSRCSWPPCGLSCERRSSVDGAKTPASGRRRRVKKPNNPRSPRRSRALPAVARWRHRGAAAMVPVRWKPSNVRTSEKAHRS